MKVVKSSVEIIDQEPGVIGMKKHIERVGRISYKSEGLINEDSWIRFIKMLYERGHWAVFNLGTVYLKVPIGEPKLEELLNTLYTKWTKDDNYLYITTNYRVICQLGLEDFMTHFWCEPNKYHFRRVTTHWICSRFVSHQIIRHRCLSPIQESQRYVNYEKKKNGGGISYILPQWAYRVRDDIASTVDSLTGESREWIRDLDGEELWDELCIHDRTVASRDRMWHLIEDEYKYELSNGGEGEVLKPEEARGILCNDTKTELCLCGFIRDWMYEPDPLKTSEKAGFFYLRCAPDAQVDVRVLAQSLKDQFISRGFDKMK